ncbi:hypothetical protein F4779DRAFT_38155 [Xylariaceae sp. FL0662B]|nr:hypothetical protein F4779DRAFT_38155 [Xylariaceae sp. FL0662B]
MAQSSHSWPAMPYSDDVGGIHESDINYNPSPFAFQPYQDHQSTQSFGEAQSNQPYERPGSSNHFFENTDFHGYQPVHTNNHLGNGGFVGDSLPDANFYFTHGAQYSNADSNGSNIHGHGTSEVQQYGDLPFNSNDEYPAAHQSQLRPHPQFTAGQPGQNQSHVPNGFNTHWQGSPLQHAQSQYDQGALGYENHNHQQAYQQQPQVSPYPSLRTTMYQKPTRPLDPQNGQARFSPQPAQNLAQSYHLQQTPGDAVHRPYDSIPPPNSQAIMDIRNQTQAPHIQTHVTGQLPIANSPRPVALNQLAPAVIGGTPASQYSSPRTNIPAIAPGPQPQALPDMSQMGQFVDSQIPTQQTGIKAPANYVPGENGVGASQDNLITEAAWKPVPGCQHLLVKNPPKQNEASFSTTFSNGTKSSYVAKHNTYKVQLLPKRTTRLPCEIERDRDELCSQLQSIPLSDTAKQQMDNEIAKLDAELIIVAEDEVSKLGTTETKAKAGTKRKEPNSKESMVDRQAREIKSLKTRPVDLIKGIEHDIIAMLWRDPKTPEPSQDEVFKLLNAFGDYVTGLWTESRALKTKLGAAQEKNDKEESKSLQAALDSKYDAIRAAIETAIKFGDKFYLTQIGIHTKLLGGLFIILRNCFASKDYNGPFPKALLQLMSRFTTVDTEFLTDRVKFDRVRQKYGNEVDNEGKKYINQIFANASNRTALKEQEARDDTKKTPSGLSKKTAATTSKDMAPMPKIQPPKKDMPLKKTAVEIKKIQPTDYSGLGSARKMTNGTAKANSSPAKRPRGDDTDSRTPKKVAVEDAAGAPSTTKTLPAVTTSSAQNQPTASSQARPRPTGSMLPGRSRIPAKAPPKKPAPQPSGPSNISGLLAEIQKPAEKPKPREEPARTPETPEERARRLRKESRRHLRVMWKSDDQLAEVRLFELDSAEDKGRASNVRDARDNRSEGQMLKRKFQDEEDDDDDKSSPKETILREWFDPSKVDFSSMDSRQREKSFVTRGGTREIESEQKRIMDEYESRELMAIYTSFSEIPETPKSPSNKDDTKVPTQTKIVYLSSDTPRREEIHRRWSETAHLGQSAAQQLAFQRAGISASTTIRSHHNPARSFQSQPEHTIRTMTQDERDTEVFALLKSNHVKNYIDPDPYDPAKPRTQRRYDYPDPKVQQVADALEAIVAQLKDKPYPPTEPPDYIKSDPERVKEWNMARDNDVTARAMKEAKEWHARFMDEHARTVTQASQSVPAPQPTAQANPFAAYQAYLQPQYQPYQQQTQQVSPDKFNDILEQVRALQSGQASQAAAAPPPPQLDNSLHSLLAALGQPSQVTQAPTPAPAPAPTQTADYTYWQNWAQNQAQSYGSTQAQSSQSYGAQPYGGLPYDDQPYSDAPSQGTQQQRDNDRGNRKDLHRVNKDQKGINRSLIGTKPCTFWAKGQCAKGDKCTFRHDPNDLK